MKHYTMSGMCQALSEYYQVMSITTFFFLFKLLLIYFLYVHIDARGQLYGVGSVFPLYADFRA